MVKILSYAGFGVGLIAGAMALYLHFVVLPECIKAEQEYENLEKDWERTETTRIGLSDTAWNAAFESHSKKSYELLEKSHVKMDYGTYLMFICPLGFLLSIYPAYKKNKFAMAGVALSLVSCLIGAVEGTHMMS